MNILFIHQHVPVNASLDEKDVLQQRDQLSTICSEMGHTVDYKEIVSHLDLISLTELSHTNCIVFNLCESLFGRDDLMFLVPLMLEHFGIPFTGSGWYPIALSCHKLESKKLMIQHNILTPRYVTNDTEYDISLHGTYIVKPYNTHASLSINQDSIINVYSKQDFFMLKQKLTTHDNLFAEEYIDGREFNISLLATDNGVTILPHAEMLFVDYPDHMYKIVDYDAKWNPDSFAYNNTIRRFTFDERDIELLKKINTVALAVWDVFHLNGYARIDFRVCNDLIYVLEVNPNPCLSLDGGFMAAVQEQGLTFHEALERILQHPIKPTQTQIS